MYKFIHNFIIFIALLHIQEHFLYVANKLVTDVALVGVVLFELVVCKLPITRWSLLPSWFVGVVALEVFKERAVERFNFNEDWEGDLDRQREGVAEGDEDSEHVDELNEAARLCKLNDFESLEFSNESRVT